MQMQASLLQRCTHGMTPPPVSLSRCCFGVMSNARAEELRSAGKDAKMAVTLMRGHAGKQERQKRVLRALGLMYVMNTMYTNTKRAILKK